MVDESQPKASETFAVSSIASEQNPEEESKELPSLTVSAIQDNESQAASSNTISLTQRT